MPAIAAISTPTGLIPAHFFPNSLQDAAQHEPSGVYTVTRTYQGNRVVMFNEHLDRMEHSAQLENIALKIDRPRLRRHLRSLVGECGYTESRFRITVPFSYPDHYFITIEAFVGIPIEDKQQGVRVITVPIERQNPQAKDNAWMEQREAAKANAPTAYEYLILNPKDEILEGFGSNFYAIQDQRLYTAPDETVLGGIARKIALSIAPEFCEVLLKAIHQKQIPDLDEAFLTSSSRGIIPIIAINAHTIGDGKPGALTQDLSAAYDAWVDNHLEAI